MQIRQGFAVTRNLKEFKDLTAGGQARRLRVLAERAIAQYDIRVQQLRLISNATNGIYEVVTRSGPSKILRVANPTGCNGPVAIDLELAWLRALDRDTDIGAPLPIDLPDGRSYTTQEAPGVPEPRYCMLFSWVSGRNIGAGVTVGTVRAWGALSARLHAHASKYRAGRSRSARPYDRTYVYSHERFPPTEPIATRVPEFRKLLPPSRRRTYEKSAERIQSVIDELWLDRRRIHLLHGDLHPWNTRVHEGRAYPIDFEDLVKGHPAQDIAVSLYYIRTSRNYPRLRRAFQEGYETIRPWPVPGEEVLEALMAGRSLVLMNWVVNSSTVDANMQKIVVNHLRKVDKRQKMFLRTGSIEPIRA